MERAAGDIFVISDVHLGDGGPRDNFEAAEKTPAMHAFIDHVGSEGGELFILGDLFELWQMNLSVLLVKRREMLDRFASVNLTYVPGNHDVDLLHFIGAGFLDHPFFDRMRAPFLRTLGGRRFRFCHGHETDPFNAGDDPGFGRMLAIFAGIFEDQNGSPFLESGESVEDLLEQFGESMLMIWKAALASIKGPTPGRAACSSDALTPAQSPDRLGEHVAGVRADLERHGYDAVVLGHTHKAGRIGDWYFNSGSWVGRQSSFLRISPEGDVRLFDWQGRRAVELEMPIVMADTKPGGARSSLGNPFHRAIVSARTLFPRPTKPERSRWILLVQGALALSLGVFATTVSVGQGTTAGFRLLVSAFGLFALLDGVISIFGASRELPVRRLFSRVRGAATLLVGLVVLRRGYAVEIFVILVGVLAFVAGALRVAAAVVLRRMVDAKWLSIAGAGSMIAGLVLLFLPASTALLKFTLSGYLCYYGAGEILAGIFGQRPRRAAAQRPGEGETQRAAGSPRV